MNNHITLRLSKIHGVDRERELIKDLPDDEGINRLYYLFMQLTNDELLNYRFLNRRGEIVFHTPGGFNEFVYVSFTNKPDRRVMVVSTQVLPKLIYMVGLKLFEEERKQVTKIKINNNISLYFDNNDIYKIKYDIERHFIDGNFVYKPTNIFEQCYELLLKDKSTNDIIRTHNYKGFEYLQQYGLDQFKSKPTKLTINFLTRPSFTFEPVNSDIFDVILQIGKLLDDEDRKNVVSIICDEENNKTELIFFITNSKYK